MNSLCRLCGGFFLLGFAGIALFLSGCGGGSKPTPPPTNLPLTVEGSWKISASDAAGSSGFNASIVVLTPQSGDCNVPTPIGITFTVTGATSCFIADANANQGSVSGVTGKWDYPPAGFMFGLASVDPVAANSTAQMLGFLVETDGTNVEIVDLNGTITATTKTISGSFSCDAQSPNPCNYSGTFTAVHQ